jgi:hypothetical protein
MPSEVTVDAVDAAAAPSKIPKPTAATDANVDGVDSPSRRAAVSQIELSSE